MDVRSPCLLALLAAGWPVTAGAGQVFSDTRLLASDGAVGARFGDAVAGAGDVDGDGYDDVLAGAYLADGMGGEAYLYFGASTGVDPGSEQRLANPGVAIAYFGWSVAGVGDLNGDGYDDVLVGAAYDTSGGESWAGSAWLYPGSAAGLDTAAAQRLSAPEPVEAGIFGRSCAGAGDVDGDGQPDVVVGTWSHSPAAYLFSGDGAGLDGEDPQILVGTSTDVENWFGYAVAGAGDVDGDGYWDVLVGAWGEEAEAGAAYLFRGGAGGLDSAGATRLTAGDADAGDHYGFALAGPGDLDGDGYAEVVVGAEEDDAEGEDAGAVYLYLGGASGLDTAGEQKITASDAAPGFHFGASVAGAGDVDGDGHPDLAVGSYWDAEVSVEAGSVLLFLGGAGGLDLASETKLTADPADPWAWFGWSVAGAGDVDGDGWDDLVVGGPAARDLGMYTGAVHVLVPKSDDADGDGVLVDEDCDDTDAAVGAPVAWYADLDGDGFGDPAHAEEACAGPSGWVADGGDCDDDSAVTFPGAAPDDDREACMRDEDDDGWGDESPPAGVTAGEDCDDTEAAIHPGAEDDECSDAVDEDCDGEGDADGDGDEDGLSWTEEQACGTDPCEPDSDRDGLTDGDEVAAGSDPTLDDTDGDGLDDGEEAALGTDPTLTDTDGDGHSDADEVTEGTDPLDPDSPPRAEDEEPPDDEGCGGCASGRGGAGWWLLAGLGLVAGRRRRR
ncbi:MAG: FG-GAP-like repeat-containing protein [Pseudomonadota bacterium]